MRHPLVIVLGVALAALIAVSTASAQRTQVFRADLRPVPLNPPAKGDAKLHLKGSQLKVILKAAGVSPGLPHAMHIHGDLQAENECPPASADVNNDGLNDVLEGVPFYGPILVSFTTVGDTTPASALDLDRFPVADAMGTYKYMRRFTIPPNVALNLGHLHIVIHGEDLNHDGRYDGPIGPLGVPMEATLPVACGEIN
jgi:hypothetical protein